MVKRKHNERKIFVHPGPYRCIKCGGVATHGENFSMRDRGEGFCSPHWKVKTNGPISEAERFPSGASVDERIKLQWYFC